MLRSLTVILLLNLALTWASAQNESKPMSDAKAKAKAASVMKKDIAQARAYLKAGNNLDKVEQLMQKHLADTANRHNEKLWLIMFDAVRKQYDQGNMKLYLKQKYDTASLFNLTKRMFTILEAFDSVDARPDERGEVRPQYRKKHAEFLHAHRSNLYNGGVYFMGKQNFTDAYSFFDLYLDTAYQPLFSSYDYDETDERMPEAAYWAVYCAYKNQDPKATLHHTYMALKDTAHYCMMLQYLAETYKLEKDTARYVATLNEGFCKYPTFPFFFPRLVEYYVGNAQWESLLTIANRAQDVDSTSLLYQQICSTALLNLQKYDECIEICDKIIAKDDSLSEAWYNAGISCYNQAVEVDKNIKMTAKQKKLMLAKYERACYYLERYRQLAPDQQDRWAMPLYNIYLNLNKGKEFDEIDRLIRQKK